MKRVRAMEANCSKLTERILQLTLEIIYLLTGEDNVVVWKPSGDGQNSILVPLRSLTIPERNNNKRILEINQEIAELLTGEIGNFCSSDINIKEEIKEEKEEEESVIKQQESLEGYKDVMMASQPALTSPDGSSNGNPPERCPRPLYSRDSTHEDLTIPHHHQGVEAIYMKSKVKEEEETYVKENHQCKKEAEMAVTKEESSLDISTGAHEAWNTSEEHLILPPDYNGETNGQPSFPSTDEAPEPSQPKETSCNNFSVTQKDEKLFSSTFQDSFTKEHDLVLRQETHTTCSECNKSFTHSSLLYEHQRIHTGEKPFSCLICKKSFKQKRGLILHERIHSQEKPFSCSECEKSFTFQSHLLNHQKSHTREKRYSCSECGKSFISQSHLHRHQRLHTGEKPFSCSECGKSFSQKSVLNGHLNLHTGEKPYSCSVCRQSFTFQSQLSRHHRAHRIGKKPFPCSVCERSFATKAQVIQHERIHTGEKPFSCSECGKSFTAISVRNRHLRVHTREKPFSCSKCGKCFTNKGNRDTHMKIHTG